MTRTGKLLISILFAAGLLSLPGTALAWPAHSDWVPIYRGSSQLSDPRGDAPGNDARDVVGDANNSAAFLFNDGNYIYFRARVDKDPRKNPAGELIPSGWGFLVDTNQNLDDYEYMIMLDGIANPDVMYLARNTQQKILGDPSDKAEIITWQENLTYLNNFRVLGPAESGGPTTAFGGDADFFIDWFIPYDVFKNSLGLQESSIIRYVVGSANNAMTLTADIVQGSTLYDSSSNFVLPSGKQPTTGSVAFVADPGGTVELTEFYAGATIYIKVTDGDLNTVASQAETVTVKVQAPSGDVEAAITLTETGPDTGIFIGHLPTFDGPEADSDGTLQTTPTEIITVSYIDAADGTSPTPLRNQLRTDTALALPAADLAVSKSASNATPNEGDIIDYTVVATNLGPSAASGVQITDLLPTGVTYLSYTASPGTSYNPATGIWAAGSLARNASKSLLIRARVDNGTAQTSITNTATRTAGAQPDPNSSNNSASAAISVVGADLSITQTASNLTPPMGGTEVFTITVANLGGNTATNVEVTDLLPAATWNSVTVNSASQGSTAYGDGTLTWNVGTLPYPGSATLVVSATLSNSAASGTTIVNTVAITHSDQRDPNPANDSAAVSMIVGGVDLSLAKTVTSPTPAIPDEGELVVFTVTVGNGAASSTTATGVEVTDVLPPGLTLVTATPSQGNFAAANGIWNVGGLAPGASATLSLTARVQFGQAGRTLTNTAAITRLDQVDVNPGNHTASASVTVRHTDLKVEKTVSNPTPGSAGSIAYTVTVTNLGAQPATNVSVFDQLPGQVTFQSYSASQGNYSSATHLWSGISLAAYDPANPAQTNNKATLTISVALNLKQNDPRTFYNTAALNSSTPGDNNSTNDVSSAVVSIDGTDLAVTQTMAPGFSSSPASGSQTRFLITVTNNGPNPAAGIVVKDEWLPASGLSSCGAASMSQGSFAANQCQWTVGELIAGASATLYLNANITAANGTTVTNRAGLTSVTPDPVDGNNIASQILHVGATDLGLTKTVDNPEPNVGEMVTFTVTLTNHGTNGVNGVQVTDLLPEGLTLVTSAPNAPGASQGTFDSATGFWTVGAVNFPASATLTLKAIVNAGTGGTVLTSEARITAAGALDPDLANNRAGVSVTVQQADAYIETSVDNPTPYVGETVVFTITAGNNGPHRVTNLVVRDLLPATPDSSSTPNPVFAGIVGTPSQGTYDPATGDWVVGSLEKNALATLTLVATVNPGSHNQNVTNMATRLSADQSDPNAANNSDSVTLTPQHIDLRLTKTADPAAPVEGSEVVFTLTVYNLHASRTATGVQITESFPSPPAVTYLAHSAGQGSYDPGTGLWDVGSLNPMSNATLAITARIACGEAGNLFTNSASVTSREQPDENPENDSAAVDILPADASPSLTVVKMADAPAVRPGDVVTYTVQVLNSGCGKATNVVLDDRMSPYTAWSLNGFGESLPFQFTDSAPPSGLALGIPVYSDDQGVSWGYGPTSGAGMPAGYDGAVTNWRTPMDGSMKAGGSITLRYRVMVK